MNHNGAKYLNAHAQILKNFFVIEPDFSKESKIKCFIKTVQCQIKKTKEKATVFDRYEAAIENIEKVLSQVDKHQKKFIEGYLKEDLEELAI